MTNSSKARAAPCGAGTETEEDREASAVRCAKEGCGAEANYRAPRSREALHDYIWFCLEHVREYNRKWNYYDGMEGDELEAEIRSATTWERPSWKFATGGMHGQGFDDTLGLFMQERTRDAERERRIDPEERRAWRVMCMKPVADIAEVKLQYKRLAKEHHPDINGSDERAEERLKEINLAYDLICRNLQAVGARASA